jgi:3-oxoacyl-(acyl-carrier-protein) synthase
MTLSQKDAANEYFVNTEAGENKQSFWNRLRSGRNGGKVQDMPHHPQDSEKAQEYVDYTAQVQKVREELALMRTTYTTTIQQLRTDNAAKDSEITQLREICDQAIAKKEEKNEELMQKEEQNMKLQAFLHIVVFDEKIDKLACKNVINKELLEIIKNWTVEKRLEFNNLVQEYKNIISQARFQK